VITSYLLRHTDSNKACLLPVAQSQKASPLLMVVVSTGPHASAKLLLLLHTNFSSQASDRHTLAADSPGCSRQPRGLCWTFYKTQNNMSLCVSS
jgi:hypothetical protein